MLSFFGPRQEKRLNHKLPRPLRGVVTAMVTPLNQDLTLDQQGLERLVEHLVEGGVHGIFILGTTGEFRQKLADSLAEKCNDVIENERKRKEL